MFHRRKKIIWVWDDTAVSKWWQLFNILGEISQINKVAFDLYYSLPKCFSFFYRSKYFNTSTELQNWYNNPCRFYSVGLCFRREAVPYVRDAQQRTEEQPEHLLKSHTFMFCLRDFKRTFLTNIFYFYIVVGSGKLKASFQISVENVVH